MKKTLIQILLSACLLGLLFGTTACTKNGGSKQETTQDSGKDQSEGKQKMVEAAYDEYEEVIIGEGLVYEVLKGNDAAMTVATYHDVELEEITIPEKVRYDGKVYSVTEIAESAFESNVLLRKITLPKGMKAIGINAFYSCPELTEVIFSDTVTSIGASCFAECPELSQVKLPDSLEAIGEEAFSNCVSLQEMSIPAKVKMMDRAVFFGCEKLTECRFEKGVTQIGNEMFTNCYALSKVEIPDTVTMIGMEAFWACESLTGITLPDSVAMIGNRAFYSTGLHELRLPAAVSGITVEMLEGMDNLEKLIVPEVQKTNCETVFKNYDLEIASY